MAQRRIRVIDAVAYLLVVGIALRGLRDYSGSGVQGIVLGLMLAFFLLSISKAWFHRRFNWYPHLYFSLQTIVVVVLSLLPTYVDYFVILYVLLSIEAMSTLPQQTAFLWIGVFSLAMGGVLLYTFGWGYALPMIVIYIAAYLFFASYASTTRRAEESHAESQALLSELQAAHRELQAYAAQVEELTAAEERNRLARELHDSVTQTIFSMTLTAESTRILLERDPTQVAAQLDRLQELAKGALAEMRSLISHLRPKTVAEEGLLLALRRHVAERGEQDGLTVALHVEGCEEEETRLPPETEEALFRIVQEALNNVVKHAQTDHAEVTLRLREKSASLSIEDPGIGFDPSRASTGASHLGLTGMRERVRALGGTLEIVSRPGTGTRIRVEAPLAR